MITEYPLFFGMFGFFGTPFFLYMVITQFSWEALFVTILCIMSIFNMFRLIKQKKEEAKVMAEIKEMIK